MKIGFFSWEYPPFLVGGLGIYSLNMVKKFVERGNEVFVFTMNFNSSSEFEEKYGIKVFRPVCPESAEAISIFANEDIRSWGKNIKLFSDIFNYNLFSAKKFIELNKKEKFDLIAIHDWISAFAGIFLKDLGIPTVFHLHSVEEVRNHPGSETLKNLERKMAREADKIITVSEAMKDFIGLIGYEKEKISVCWNGTDPELLNPSKVNQNLLEKLKEKYGIEDKVVFFIGRLTWFKGIFNLVKAMPLVLGEFPKTKLIIVGIGEKEETLRLSKNLGIEKNVVLVDKWLSDEEKVAHYSLADVCVFPSINEPFGIVASEAMAMEKPVVVGASGVSGFKEQVVPCGEERTGVHVDGNRPEDIAWGIKEVLRNLDEAKKWGKNGRKRVLEKFTFDIAADKTLSIYESLIK